MVWELSVDKVSEFAVGTCSLGVPGARIGIESLSRRHVTNLSALEGKIIAFGEKLGHDENNIELRTRDLKR